MCYAANMAILTIPKKMEKMAKEDLVIIPRKEYEKLLFREPKVVAEVPMTASEKKSFARAEKNLKAGKLLSADEFARKMGIKRRT